MTRSTLLAAVFYGTLALGLLAPMASNVSIPLPPEHASHTALIVQARMAIEQGQFPIRVAPWQHQGWLYPVFQFYSPLPYTIGGLVHRWMTPQNPFLAYKLMIWGALLVGGLFVYLAARLLTGSHNASLVAGIVYMTAPYWLVNIHSRGAFTEALAQGELPIVIYCSLRCYSASRTIWILATGLSWCLLALTHTITYLSSGIFVSLLFVSITIGQRGAAPGLRRVGAAFGLGGLLALYFLVPVATSDHLMIHERFGNVFETTWLTTLPALLSPVSLPPVPLPDARLPPHFSTSIGWPLLLGVAVVLWTHRIDSDRFSNPLARRARPALLGLFGLAALVTWSPVDVWSWLPHAAHVMQFSYRFLSQVAWTGALIAAYAAVQAFRDRPDVRETAAYVLLILAAQSSFLPVPTDAKVDLHYLMKSPDMGWGRDDYLFNPKFLPPDEAGEVIPTMSVETMPPHCARLGDAVKCHFVVTDRPTRAQLPVLFYPEMLDFTVNGRQVPYFPLSYHTVVLAGVRLEPGTYDLTARFRGVSWANLVSGVTWVATLMALVVLLARDLRSRALRTRSGSLVRATTG